MNEPFEDLPVDLSDDFDLEVRITALVMGEASDIERESLEQLIDERPELSALKSELENLHGILGDVGTGDIGCDKDWRLSDERRRALFAILDEQPASEQPASAQPASAVASDAPKSVLARKFGANHKRFSRLAAMAAIFIAIAGLGFVALRPDVSRRLWHKTSSTAMSTDAMTVEEASDGASYEFFLAEPDHMFGRANKKSPQSQTAATSEGLSIAIEPTATPQASPGLEARRGSRRRKTRTLAESPSSRTTLDSGVSAGGMMGGVGGVMGGPGSGGAMSGAGVVRSKRESNAEDKSGPTLGFSGTSGLPDSNRNFDFRELRGGTALHYSEAEKKSTSRFDVPAAPEQPLRRYPKEHLQEQAKSLPEVEAELRSKDSKFFSRIAEPMSVADQEIEEQVVEEHEAVLGESAQKLDARFGASSIESKDQPTPKFQYWDDSANGARLGDISLGRKLVPSTVNRSRAAKRKTSNDGLVRSESLLKRNSESEGWGKAEETDGESMAMYGVNGGLDFGLADRDFAENPISGGLGIQPIQPTWNENDASQEAFSTFSLHVSDVSFKLAAAALAKGEWPDPKTIRIEEFVNAMDYGDPNPGKHESVACQVEQSIHPFLQQRNMMRVSLKTAAAGRAAGTPLRLTFLLDNSGSMERLDRQRTVRQAFRLLAAQLQPSDQVTLISFARQPRLLADKVGAAKAMDLVQLIEELPSEGGTNIESALQLAFEKASEQYSETAQNRIILLTDGAANLGDAQPDSLARYITTIRDAGIAFDAAGIGADGLNDEVLEALTRKGDGRYYLLDSAEDADAGFVRQLAGALRPSAKNVKVQIEFNPQRVGKYKLLGFEKHRLNKEDFRNDAVDAAEMGAAEAGVAVYQFEAMPDGRGDVGSVSIRFQDLSTGKMVEQRWPISYRTDAPRPDQASASMRIATAAALLATKLSSDPVGETVQWKTLQSLMSSLPASAVGTKRVVQLQQMIDQARSITKQK